jgi:copper chaperone
METAVLKVGGMTCGGCVGSVARVLQAVPGVEKAEVSLEKGEARVVFDPATASLAQLRGAIDNAGYEAL